MVIVFALENLVKIFDKRIQIKKNVKNVLTRKTTMNAKQQTSLECFFDFKAKIIIRVSFAINPSIYLQYTSHGILTFGWTSCLRAVGILFNELGRFGLTIVR